MDAKTLAVMLFFLLFALLIRILIFGPGQHTHEILRVLKGGPKTLDELQKLISLKPEALKAILELMEYNSQYIIRQYRNPIDEKGERRSQWVFSITTIGREKFESFQRSNRD